jgi:hypothetical protein
MPAFDTPGSQKSLTTNFCSFPTDTGRDAIETDCSVTKDLLFIHDRLRRALHYTGFTSQFDPSQVPDEMIEEMEHSFLETHRSYYFALNKYKLMLKDGLTDWEGKNDRESLIEGRQPTTTSSPIITAESLDSISQDMRSALIALDEAFDNLCRPVFTAEGRATDVANFRKKLTDASTLHYNRWSIFCQAQDLKIEEVSRELWKSNPDFDLFLPPVSITWVPLSSAEIMSTHSAALTFYTAVPAPASLSNGSRGR